jgi:uncharacterized protein (TIGR03435 family)
MKTALAGAILTVILQAQSISYLATVKPNNAADARGLSEYSPGGRYTATAITVLALIRNAYRIQKYQLADAPAWLADKRFDIVAKVEGEAPTQQKFLQTLLADHFKLAVHKETRNLPRYALVAAKTRLKRSDFDCATYNAMPHPAPTPGVVPPCGGRINMGSISAKSMPMAQLATSLSVFVDRFVVDKTGLSGGFDVELTWNPDAAQPDLDRPSIFAALQEQLGLKLVPEKGPVEILVVNHVEEPLPDR